MSLTAIAALILYGKGFKIPHIRLYNGVFEKTRNEINLHNGIATVKGSNEKFTGIVKDMLTSDKVGFKPFDYILEYKDAVLIKINKKQGENIIKIFKTIKNGSRKIIIKSKHLK